MKAFLQLIAEELYTKYNGDFSKLTIVFPNKRASLFMNQHLAHIANGRPLWTPRYTTIADIFSSLSNIREADKILLVCRLYTSFCNITGSTETIDQFWTWGELMLEDFEDIDQNLVNAEKLFTNIGDLEALTDFTFLEQEQIDAIHRFFVNFDHKSHTRLKDKFISVWDALYPIYKDFKDSLLAESLAFPGMMKRAVIENIKENSEDLSQRLHKGDYVVIGFNVLNEVEKRLFKFIQKERNTSFYWDYDKAYCSPLCINGESTTFEAGQFIQKNIQTFGNCFDEHPEYFDNFSKKKTIRFISTPTEDAQSRYTAQWINETITPQQRLNESAIVLCNEKTLQPVLHSIPNHLNDGDKTPLVLNVTMGYPLTETPIFSFIETLIELQSRGRTDNNTWRYRNVADVLRHPYTRRMCGGVPVKILSELKRHNIMFPEEKYFKDNDFLKMVFSVQNSQRSLLDYLRNIVKAIGVSYKCETYLKKATTDTQLFTESIYNTFTLISRIRTLLDTEEALNSSTETPSRLLRQLLSSKSIPFHGEPAIGLQVMGILETRNLDFRNLIMYSVNEGQLPKSDHRSSLIPYNIRKAYGMTTMEKQVSLYAYYFYRLLQRAENITLVYNTSTDGLVRGEMSRFMTQLMIENEHVFAPGQHIDLQNLTAKSISMTLTPIEGQKDENTMRRLNNRWNLLNEEKYKERHNGKMMLLSPSAINCYMRCQFQFYLKYLAEMNKEDDVSENVDNAIFGTIFHHAMQELYKPLLNRRLTKSELISLAKDRVRVEAAIDVAFSICFFRVSEESVQSGYHPQYNGEQLLNRYVLITYVINQILYDAEQCPFIIRALEDEFFKILTVPTFNGEEKTGEMNVRIGGIIDRLDLCNTGSGEFIKVIDYKTSSQPHKTKSVETLFNSGDAYHIMQALYYCETLSDKVNIPLVPMLMYIKVSPDKRTTVKLDKAPIDDYVSQVQKEYAAELKSLISDIFNPAIPFSQTGGEHTCEYCDFVNLCNKR